ncbi:GNAT family N-acetyltransferase [Clostridium intestinale]|uniref:GNAT family acetyltransferase n=1 Tax=Clostridium intestinale URNW TaxID=1294142 RepID=U2N3G8_9CLOT|nr:GNAT family N-acetyltransferase [Clostridium intestinale]ERK30027.1 GNAT family acetyltransferase [Clostridium intestinale URNW]
MNYKIKGDLYKFINNIRENDKIRNSFNLLAQNTFEISFETWYQNGYWGEDYIPYCLLKDDKVVANVSVNIIKTRWNDEKRIYIQLGTVMTDKEFRNKGLSSFLIEKVLEEWRDKCHSIYLFANDRVLDYYPKFGFEKAEEYQYSKNINKKSGLVRKLNMDIEVDKQFLLDLYKNSNPFSSLPMEENEGLLMFYCSQFMKENLYYIKGYEAIVIAEYDGKNLICYDIFCKGNCSLDEILSIMSEENTKTAILGFTPKVAKDFKINKLHEEDTTLFILKGKENLFSANKLMFPVLSHA